MGHISLPKEYLLPQPAVYDERKFKMHLAAVLTINSLNDLYEKDNHLFMSFFLTNDHKEIANDILRWVLDVSKGDSREIIIKRLMASMYEAGFFG